MPDQREIQRRQAVVGRFMQKVARTETCWLWKGALTLRGYGQYRLGGRTRKSHQASWEIFNGPIPKGMEVNHLCLNRACVRPDHLELATHRQNMLFGNTIAAVNARKTHCPHGHPYSPENTTVRKNRSRECATCNRLRAKRWREEKKRQDA